MSMARVYPFSVSEPKSSAWRVTVDGEYCPLHLARVSAYPINRRWPGHQRSAEETELAAFALFETDGLAEIEVMPARPFWEVIVRPLSRGVTPSVQEGVIRFTLPGPGQYTVELDGSHGALHLFADPARPYDADPAGDRRDLLWAGRA